MTCTVRTGKVCNDLMNNVQRSQRLKYCLITFLFMEAKLRKIYILKYISMLCLKPLSVCYYTQRIITKTFFIYLHGCLTPSGPRVPSEYLAIAEWTRAHSGQNLSVGGYCENTYTLWAYKTNCPISFNVHQYSSYCNKSDILLGELSYINKCCSRIRL